MAAFVDELQLRASKLPRIAIKRVLFKEEANFVAALHEVVIDRPIRLIRT
jgi:hypothetical protein